MIIVNDNVQEVLGPTPSNSPLQKGFKENTKKIDTIIH